MGIIESRPPTIKSISLFDRLQYNKPTKTLRQNDEKQWEKKE